MDFEIVSDIQDIETIARGAGIRESPEFVKFMAWGVGENAREPRPYVSWINPFASSNCMYEATGIGRREYKIKRYLD